MEIPFPSRNLDTTALEKTRSLTLRPEKTGLRFEMTLNVVLALRGSGCAAMGLSQPWPIAAEPLLLKTGK